MYRKNKPESSSKEPDLFFWLFWYFYIFADIYITESLCYNIAKSVGNVSAGRKNMDKYKLLLVDDEEEVIQVIMKKICWEEIGRAHV